MQVDVGTVMGYVFQVLPAVASIAIGALAGGLTTKKLLASAGQIVFLLANKELENHEKRAAAIGLLYREFPKLGLLVPIAAMGSIVDTAWDQVVKPLATAATVAVSVSSATPAGATPPTPAQ